MINKNQQVTTAIGNSLAPGFMDSYDFNQNICPSDKSSD